MDRCYLALQQWRHAQLGDIKSTVWVLISMQPDLTRVFLACSLMARALGTSGENRYGPGLWRVLLPFWALVRLRWALFSCCANCTLCASFCSTWALRTVPTSTVIGAGHRQLNSSSRQPHSLQALDFCFCI
jgi:hypothetical protein